MFNYGSFKLLLLKVSLGILLFVFSVFLFVSLYTYNPNDPGMGRLLDKSEITNFFGFWGAIFSSIFLTLFGKASFFLVIYLLYLGVFLFFGLVLKRPFLKILLILFSLNLINISLLLQESVQIDAGILSNILFDIYKYYFPFLVYDFLYRLLSIVCFSLISIILFLYCFSINISFLKNIISKIFNLNFFKAIYVIKLPKQKKLNLNHPPEEKVSQQ